MRTTHRVVWIACLLACSPTAVGAQDIPAECDAASIESLDPLHPWRNVMPLSNDRREEPPVRCLKIVLRAGEVVRAVATMEADPPSSGVRILVYVPGKAAPAVQTGLGAFDRLPVTWRAEASGPHYLVVRDAWSFARGVTKVPVGIRVEQVEPPVLADARLAALAADPRVAWLRQNVLTIRSIDPADMDFSDLRPLRSALENVRVILLGEADHRSGSDFLAKSRLVKFLHQELGFEVLAFEAGLHGMTVAWERLRSGTAPRQALAEGAWGFWANSQQMQSLLDYVAKQAQGKRPLALAGVDNQFSGQGGSTRFAADLADFLIKRDLAGPLGLPAGPNMHILESLAPGKIGSLGDLPDSTRSAFLGGLDETIARVSALDDDTARFWTRVLRNTACLVRSRVPVSVESPPSCLRDRQMADNIIWLANERYPGRKIIIWAGTAHAARMPELPRAGGRGPSMGQYIHEVFGAQAYAIGLTSHHTASSATASAREHIVPDQHPLPEFEELMSTAGVEYGLVDLRRARSERTWAGSEFLARPIGYAAMPAVWSDLFDALLFVREHQPSVSVR